MDTYLFTVWFLAQRTQTVPDNAGIGQSKAHGTKGFNLLCQWPPDWWGIQQHSWPSPWIHQQSKVIFFFTAIKQEEVIIISYGSNGYSSRIISIPVIPWSSTAQKRVEFGTCHENFVLLLFTLSEPINDEYRGATEMLSSSKSFSQDCLPCSLSSGPFQRWGYTQFWNPAHVPQPFYVLLLLGP